MITIKYILVLIVPAIIFYTTFYFKNEILFKCGKISQLKISKKFVLPPIYVITPTFRRPEQLAELTRLGNTLKHVKNLLWLVIEDSTEPSKLVEKVLNRIKVPHIYLQESMPSNYKNDKIKPKGVANRNRGLEWLRNNIKNNTKHPQLMGVLYFADDDNTYDISLFEEIRYTKKVSFFPVGLVTDTGVSSPILAKNGSFIGWYDGWIGKRNYALDMAGFAVSVNFLFQRPNAKMPFTPGYEEDGFLKSLTPINPGDIQYLAKNCTEILCWHTQTKKNNNPKALVSKYNETNLVKLTEMMVLNIDN